MARDFNQGPVIWLNRVWLCLDWFLGSAMSPCIIDGSPRLSPVSGQLRSGCDHELPPYLSLYLMSFFFFWYLGSYLTETPHQIKNFMGFPQNGSETPGFWQKQGFRIELSVSSRFHQGCGFHQGFM